MAGYCKIVLIGNLGRDPEIRYTPDGLAVTSFNIAVTEKVKNEDRTQWFRISAFGRLGEICGEYLSKGKQVYIEGKFHSSEWTDPEGNKRFFLNVIATEMKMLGRKDDFADSSASSPDYDKSEAPTGYNAPSSSAPNMQPSDIPDISEPSENQGAAAPEEDDIPF